MTDGLVCGRAILNSNKDAKQINVPYLCPSGGVAVMPAPRLEGQEKERETGSFHDGHDHNVTLPCSAYNSLICHLSRSWWHDNLEPGSSKWVSSAGVLSFHLFFIGILLHYIITGSGYRSKNSRTIISVFTVYYHESLHGSVMTNYMRVENCKYIRHLQIYEAQPLFPWLLRGNDKPKIHEDIRGFPLFLG